MKVLEFPESFEWGTATAAFQIEGSKGGEQNFSVDKIAPDFEDANSFSICAGSVPALFARRNSSCTSAW